MIYRAEFEEEERQMILLALEKLRRQRPGFDYALSQIEAKLGGQIAWPAAFHDDPPSVSNPTPHRAAATEGGDAP